MAKNHTQPPSKSGVLLGTPAGDPRQGPGIVPGILDDAREPDAPKTSRPPRS